MSKPNEKPMITIKRKELMYGSLYPFKVFIDGKEMGKIQNGKKINFKIDSNKHEIYVRTVGKRSNKVYIDSNSNTSIKLECGTKNSWLYTLSILFSLMSIFLWYLLSPHSFNTYGAYVILPVTAAIWIYAFLPGLWVYLKKE